MHAPALRRARGLVLVALLVGGASPSPAAQSSGSPSSGSSSASDGSASESSTGAASSDASAPMPGGPALGGLPSGDGATRDPEHPVTPPSGPALTDPRRPNPPPDRPLRPADTPPGDDAGRRDSGTSRPGDVAPSANAASADDDFAAAETRLDVAATTQNLRTSTLSTRDEPLRLAERSSLAGQTYLGMIERRSIALQGDSRQKVGDALRDARAARLELDKAISRARAANSARWDDAREDVIKRYENYSQALATAREAAVEGGTRFETPRQAPPAANDGAM